MGIPQGKFYRNPLVALLLEFLIYTLLAAVLEVSLQTNISTLPILKAFYSCKYSSIDDFITNVYYRLLHTCFTYLLLLYIECFSFWFVFMLVLLLILYCNWLQLYYGII